MDAWKRLHALAESQFGVFTVQQAAAVGIAEHQLRYQTGVGRLEAVRPNVLRVTGVATSWRQTAKAVTLWLGADSTISHPSAGRLLQLDEPSRHGDVHVSMVGEVAKGRTVSGVVLHRTQSLPDRHRIFVDGIATTSAARTVVDLAGSLGDEDLEALSESARRLGLMTIAELERVLAECGRRRGSARLARYIELHHGRTALDHRLEVKAARMLRRGGLGNFAGQHRVIAPDGRVYRVDFAWPDRRVIVECDGFRWHGQHASWKRDRRRIAALERAGWRVVIVTWDDVTRFHRRRSIASASPSISVEWRFCSTIRAEIATRPVRGAATLV